MSDPRPEPNHTSTDPGTVEPEYRSRREERREARHERRSRDPLGGLFPGLILIELGILFYATTQDWLSWNDWWKYFLVGLGAIFLIDAAAHYFVRSYRTDIMGRIIPGFVLLFIGLAFLYGFSQWWPIVLIAVGVIILISLLFRRRG
jgi:hypothetical protein